MVAAVWSTENLYVSEKPHDFCGISNSVLKAPSQAIRKMKQNKSYVTELSHLLSHASSS